MSEKLRVCLTPQPEELLSGAEKAVGMLGKYWEPGTTLRIHFRNGTVQRKQDVMTAALEWADHANLAFRFYFDPDTPPVDRAGDSVADMIVEFRDSGGGWSYIGTDCRFHARAGRTTMMLPDFYELGTDLHELGHALGLTHEHKNPLAGIEWNRDQVYTDMARWGWSAESVESNIFDQVTDDFSQFTNFDINSIMIYEIPQRWTANDFETVRTGSLSDTDKMFISQIYPVTKGMQATEVLGYDGWNGSIAVEGDTIYLASNGNLYRGKLSGNTVTEQIGTGGWDGPIAVSNGQIYLVSQDSLWHGSLTTDNVVVTELGKGGWYGPIAVVNNEIFMVADDNLRSGTIANGTAILDKTIGKGGWRGPIAVWHGNVYMVSNGNLYRGSIADNVIAEVVGTGAWNGWIAIDNGMIFHATGELRRGVVR